MRFLTLGPRQHADLARGRLSYLPFTVHKLSPHLSYQKKQSPRWKSFGRNEPKTGQHSLERSLPFAGRQFKTTSCSASCFPEKCPYCQPFHKTNKPMNEIYPPFPMKTF